MFGVFKSPGPLRKHMHFDLIKMHPKIIFSQKTLFFTILNPKNVKQMKNYPETLLNFCPLKCSWLGQNSFNIIGALVRKEFVKCSYISLFKCTQLANTYSVFLKHLALQVYHAKATNMLLLPVLHMLYTKNRESYERHIPVSLIYLCPCSAQIIIVMHLLRKHLAITCAQNLTEYVRF